ncbi:LytR C-terminal domain-containing protein [Georgenia sp. EYE_87]|uniref:LytR C-terminal domain-containing protein n=1 Tax=Georgenia sp. EYE_87 TaxID=2853448 RepID=UPI00200580A3|nr:LytR C-terminal domain-containing protein [Georgenia sp. EYE_87]MCK6212473.1 LytR C-terminal domain-containing protein [Georgenia sp. EYE_87]
MSTPHEDYPEDEFDVAGRDRTPQGVHRGPRPLLRTLLPILAVIVLAPLLAWGAISLLGGSGEPGPSAATTAAQDTAAPTAGATDGTTGEAPAEGTTEGAEPTSEAPTEEAPTEEETTEEPAGQVEYGTAIAVLNGAGVNGLAGEVVGTLASEGFTGGVADDYTSGAPATTTLYYNNPELQATAEEVARVLGIGNVVESSSATQAIAIVLRSDFQG